MTLCWYLCSLDRGHQGFVEGSPYRQRCDGTGFEIEAPAYPWQGPDGALLSARMNHQVLRNSFHFITSGAIWQDAWSGPSRADAKPRRNRFLPTVNRQCSSPVRASEPGSGDPAILWRGPTVCASGRLHSGRGLSPTSLKLCQTKAVGNPNVILRWGGHLA